MTLKPLCNGIGVENPDQTCTCPLGFMGTDCDTPMPWNIGSHPVFAANNLENGGTVKCHLQESCIFPVYTQTAVGGVPALTVGPTSGVISVQTGTSKDLGGPANVTGLFVTPVTVQTTEPGTKKMCFKIIGGSHEPVCYNVEFLPSATILPPTRPEARFTKDTLPDGSTLPCHSTLCHVILQTQPLPNNTCAQVHAAGVTAFTTMKGTQNCVTDIAFKPDSSNKQLCLHAGEPGEKRCYTVQKVDNSPDPCQTFQCSAHGSCLRETSGAECVCDVGYSGDQCQNSALATLGIVDTKPRVLEPTVTSGSLIECEVGKDCIVPVVASAGSPNSVLAKPLVDGIVSTATPQPDGKGNYKMIVKIPTPAQGVKQHCITLNSSAGLKSEPWCVFIKSKPVSTKPSGFTEPTLPDGSVISCTVGTTCTLPVTTAPGHRLKTPKTTDIPSIVEFATGNSTDQLIKLNPIESSIGDHRVCIETTEDGYSERCYTLQIKPKPSPVPSTGKQLQVIGPSPSNGTKITCQTSGCDVALLIQTSSSGKISLGKAGGGPGTVSTKTDIKVPLSPHLHNVVAKFTPDPQGPVHQILCLDVTMAGRDTSTPWCVDATVMRSPVPTPTPSSSGEYTEPAVIPCHIGSTCIIPVVTPIDRPLLSPVDLENTTVKETIQTPDGHHVINNVAVTPINTVTGIQKVCLEETLSRGNTRCLQIEVLPAGKCSNVDCSNHGECYFKTSMKVCDCEKGFTGTHCETVYEKLQCNATIERTQSIRAHHSGTLHCKCYDAKSQSMKTVIPPRVSSGQLLRVAAVSFGSGIGIWSLAGLIYLAVTMALKRKPSISTSRLFDLRSAR